MKTKTRSITRVTSRVPKSTDGLMKVGTFLQLMRLCTGGLQSAPRRTCEQADAVEPMQADDLRHRQFAAIRSRRFLTINSAGGLAFQVVADGHAFYFGLFGFCRRVRRRYWTSAVGSFFLLVVLAPQWTFWRRLFWSSKFFWP